MTARQRLDRLMPAYSATQRAVLMLRNSKAGRPQDQRLLQSTPDAQARELNHLIGMMNAAHSDLSHVIVIIRERVRQEQLRFAWLVSAQRSALEMWGIRMHFNMSAREPISESDYRPLEERARHELISVEDCAMILTEEHHVWADEDCETDEAGYRVATDKAWYRARDARVAELQGLVAAGTLTGKGKGKRLKIAAGSFYDWLGEPVPVVPDVGVGFDVRPDRFAPEVARSRDDHAFIRELLDGGACRLELPLDMESLLVLEPPDSFGVEMARVLAVTIRAGVRENWLELRAIEEQVASISASFDGEDVLHPHARSNFDEAKSGLLELHEALQRYTGPFELPEPDDEVRALVRRVVDNEIRQLHLV